MRRHQRVGHGGQSESRHDATARRATPNTGLRRSSPGTRCAAPALPRTTAWAAGRPRPMPTRGCGAARRSRPRHSRAAPAPRAPAVRPGPHRRSSPGSNSGAWRSPSQPRAKRVRGILSRVRKVTSSHAYAERERLRVRGPVCCRRRPMDSYLRGAAGIRSVKLHARPNVDTPGTSRGLPIPDRHRHLLDKLLCNLA